MGTTSEIVIRPAFIPRPPPIRCVPAGPPNGLTSHFSPCETADVAFGTQSPTPRI